MALSDFLGNVRKRAVNFASDLLLPAPIRMAVQSTRTVLPEPLQNTAKRVVTGIGEAAAPAVKQIGSALSPFNKGNTAGLPSVAREISAFSQGPIGIATQSSLTQPFRQKISETLAPVAQGGFNLFAQEAKTQDQIAAQLRAENKPLQAFAVPFTRPAGAALGFGADILRATPRAIASVGLEPAAGILSLATGKDIKAEFKPQTGFEKALLGEAPIKGIFEQQKEAQDLLQNVTGTKTDEGKLASGLFAAPLVAGLTALDLTPFGGGGKSVIKGLKKPAEEALLKSVASLHNPASANEVWGLLRAGKTAEATAKNPEVVQSFLQELKTAAPKAAEKMASDLSKIAPPTSTVPTPPVLPLKEGAQKLPVSTEAPIEGVSYFYNTKRLNIPEEGKVALNKEIVNTGKLLEETVGKTLSNKEVLNLAENSSKVLDSVVTREQTAEKIAANLKLRQQIAASLESGKVDQSFIDLWIKDKAVGEDIARQLQARRIGADPKTASTIDTLLEGIYKINKNADEIAAAAKDVDFTNPEAVAKFYRTFVKPKASDWIDVLRYNSMLSSPTTQLVNIFSNFQGTGILAPIEKTLTGGLDAIKSAITGAPREYYAKEGLEFAKGYYSNLGKAASNFWDVMKGKKLSENIDIFQIPLTAGGKARAVENVLNFPSKLLEGADQFFTALTKGGVEKSQAYKIAKGAKPKETTAEEAAYRLFRRELGSKEEGYVLDLIDFIPKKINEARVSKNPVIKWTAKLSFPFVNTGTNLFKQGIEYGPLGITTLAGNPRKLEQLSKTAIGTSVAIGVAALAASDRITWAEPANADQRNAFRAAGRQPYSVKIGDKWVSYSKLHPVLAWNFALVAATKDSLTNKRLSDDQADTALQIAGKYLNFFADQSYMKQVGNVVSAAKGDELAVTNLISNVPQQFIPFRALMSWVERATDPVQRQADPQGSLLEKQLQTLFAQIPGLAQTVPARLGPDGKPIPNQLPIFNALSPVRVTQENPEYAQAFQNILDINKITRNRSDETKAREKQAATLNEEFKNLPREELDRRAAELKASDPLLYKELQDLVKAEKLGITAEEKPLLRLQIGNGERAKFIKERLLDPAINNDERNKIIKNLSDKGILTTEVFNQIKELNRK